MQRSKLVFKYLKTKLEPLSQITFLTTLRYAAQSGVFGTARMLL
jgi:hypothetical protein